MSGPVKLILGGELCALLAAIDDSLDRTTSNTILGKKLPLSKNTAVAREIPEKEFDPRRLMACTTLFGFAEPRRKRSTRLDLPLRRQNPC